MPRVFWLWVIRCAALPNCEGCERYSHSGDAAGGVCEGRGRGNNRANKTCVNLNIFDFKINLIYMLFLSGALNWYWLNVRVENFGSECVIAAVTVRCNIICVHQRADPSHCATAWKLRGRGLATNLLWFQGKSGRNPGQKVSADRTSVIESVH